MSFKFFKYIFGVILIATVFVSAYVFLDHAKDKTPNEEAIQILIDHDIDWNAIEIELATVLTDLIQMQTIRKDEAQAAFYLQKILEKEGIQTKIIPHPDRPDKVSLVAEIGPAQSDNGVILLNHTDVVEADEADWNIPPFSGEMKDNIIYGRGALDMKGMATMELMAFIMLHRFNVPLNQKVMFLSVPDEESGGNLGAKFLLDNHEDLFGGYRFVINEGGFGIKDFPKPSNKVFTIQTSEKGILGLELTAKGSSGHGSMPTREYSSLNLIKLMNELQGLQKFSLTTQTIEFFNTLSSFYDFPENFLLKRIHNPLIQKILSERLMDNRSINAMVTNTISITNLTTDTPAGNVIPAESKAYLDIRVLPNVDHDVLLKDIQSRAQKYAIDVKVIESYPSSQSSADTDFYSILYTVLSDNIPEAQVTQYLSPGATDNRFFREKGFECYGLIPILVTMEDIATLHGKNESISLENLSLGTKILFESLVGFNQIQNM